MKKIRQECINNKNLALCFDTLNLRDITSYSSSDKVLLIKAKADVIEAIIGGTHFHSFFFLLNNISYY